MNRQLALAAALSAAIAALLVLAVPVSILLLDPASSSAARGGTPTGPRPASVPGVPQQFLAIYEGAAQQFGLGSDGAQPCPCRKALEPFSSGSRP